MMSELLDVLKAVRACDRYAAIDYTITSKQGVKTNYGWLFSMSDFNKWEFR